VNLAVSGAQNTGGSGSDTLTGIENLIGSGFNDTLTGDGNANTLSGGNGNDTLDGDDGNDTLDGGSGTDTATYASASSAVTVNLAVSGAQNTGGSGSDTLTGIENLIGSGFNDTLTGDANANTLSGGNGNDTLTGGGGSDSFLIDASLTASNVDTVADFSAANDTMLLDRSVFAALTTLGTLSSSAFVTGTAARDSSDRIIYNSTTGDLFYDSDGTGSTAAVRFAHLNAGLSVTNNNFTVVS